MKQLQERKRVLVAYLKAKVDQEDWHAVWDCAIDLMVLAVEMKHAHHG